MTARASDGTKQREATCRKKKTLIELEEHRQTYMAGMLLRLRPH